MAQQATPASTRKPASAPTVSGRVLRTAGLVTLITTLGSLLGLLRDVAIAGSFGASGETDAFLVAWTIPETATPLLVEGAATSLLIPVLASAFERTGSIRGVVARTFLPAVVLLGALTALVLVTAPGITHLVAPGLADPALAARCVRIAAPTVFFLGISGYLMATLRATGAFLWPAWVNVVYNAGIVSAIAVFGATLGISAAALGLTIGSVGMVAVQLIPFLRHVSVRRMRLAVDRRVLGGLLTFVPIGAYTLGRQSQVYVERFIGSGLGEGAISQLNYAAKIAQLPMVVATAVAGVAFPALSRHAAARRTDELRVGVERNLRLGALLILPMTAGLVVLAPGVVRVLFEHGAFNEADTMATADIMRLYSTGLFGQVMVGICVLCFYSLGVRTWYPTLAAGVGLAVTVAVDVVGARLIGTPGLALGNAIGITAVAVVLLLGIRRRVVQLSARPLLDMMWRATLAAALSGAAGWSVDRLLAPALPDLLAVVLAAVVLLAVFAAAAGLLGIDEVREARRVVRARLARRTADRG